MLDWDIWNKLKKINEGVRQFGDSFIIDYTADKHKDIVKLIFPQLYKIEILGNIYWFGYKFVDDVPSNIRAKFTRWIKGLEEDKPTESELRQFIERPIATLNKEIPLSSFTGIIYPRSGRSHLVSKIVDIVGGFLQHDLPSMSYELIKNLPKEVDFDWNSFARNVLDPMSYRDSKKYIETTLLPKIQTNNYFSIGEVPPKYRQYIKNYLHFSTLESKQIFTAIENGTILIIDDIDTTKSTLKEMLRIVNKVNPKCKIYIFTLIGKE